MNSSHYHVMLFHSCFNTSLLLKIAFELHDQGNSCCRMLTSPGEGSAGNRCRACPGEGSTGSRQQATRRGWRPARPRALVRAPGAQERPVWPVESVCWRQAQGVGARREFADIYPYF
ncbi:hypothetical protein QL285_030245 [Trifolium repens]|nr:hypothetical protein QL285_030245 [Trifolium repens]